MAFPLLLVQPSKQADEPDCLGFTFPQRPVEPPPGMGRASDATQARDEPQKGFVHLVGVGLDGAVEPAS